ncbi:MAG: TrkA family potassium uptake protein [Muribaculaceae bacterium]|nr:TrkA family potassium uptake protein [Muribaculaceae bacterium]
MRYLIIGLGIYGSNLALDLTEMGHEVIGADANPALVDAIKDNISTAYIIDSTDETSLSVLPLRNVDIVIVAIGENFGASIKTVALLKKAGVEHIFARAIDTLHEAILTGMNVERIVTPEQRAAKDLSNEMELGGQVESLHIDSDHYVLKFKSPEYFFGMKYSSLDLNKNFGLTLIAVGRPVPARNILGIEHTRPGLIDISSNPDLRVEPGDIFTCIGTAKAYKAMFRHIN